MDELSEQLAPRAEFSVVLISDDRMRRYNRRFRGEDRSTDVLSFSHEPDDDQDRYLGDVLVSVEQAAGGPEVTLLRELKVLSLHGLLHLLGYDHETDEGEMEALEKKLRREFQLH